MVVVVVLVVMVVVQEVVVGVTEMVVVVVVVLEVVVLVVAGAAVGVVGGVFQKALSVTRTRVRVTDKRVNVSLIIMITMIITNANIVGRRSRGMQRGMREAIERWI